ncbi:MAG: hypothetical protein ABWZ76_03690 [Acidimicrobiales bacterium]
MFDGQVHDLVEGRRDAVVCGEGAGDVSEHLGRLHEPLVVIFVRGHGSILRSEDRDTTAQKRRPVSVPAAPRP